LLPAERRKNFATKKEKKKEGDNMLMFLPSSLQA
jgi:hypothetical protein